MKSNLKYFSITIIFCALMLCFQGTGCDKTVDPKNEEGETDGVQINFELSANIQNALGGGINDVNVLLCGDKYVWNSEEERYDLHNHFENTLVTKTIWNVIAYPGFTDPYLFGYKIGKVGSHDSYVVLNAKIVGYDTYGEIIFRHPEALSAGENSTVEKTIVLVHPDN